MVEEYEISTPRTLQFHTNCLFSTLMPTPSVTPHMTDVKNSCRPTLPQLVLSRGLLTRGSIHGPPMQSEVTYSASWCQQMVSLESVLPLTLTRATCSRVVVADCRMPSSRQHCCNCVGLFADLAENAQSIVLAPDHRTRGVVGWLRCSRSSTKYM